ncbi:ATP-binding protein, partial [Streptomyces sp. 7R007]
MGSIPTARETAFRAPAGPVGARVSADGGAVAGAPAPESGSWCAPAPTILSGTPHAPGSARAVVRAALDGWAAAGSPLPERLGEDAVLVASELVTNAVVHAGTEVSVACRLEEATGALVVEVSDHHPSRAPRDPAAEPPYGTAEYGRGLRLVATLAESWGVTYRRGTKTVWARLLENPDGGADGRLVGCGEGDGERAGRLGACGEGVGESAGRLGACGEGVGESAGRLGAYGEGVGERAGRLVGCGEGVGERAGRLVGCGEGVGERAGRLGACGEGGAGGVGRGVEDGDREVSGFRGETGPAELELVREPGAGRGGTARAARRLEVAGPREDAGAVEWRGGQGSTEGSGPAEPAGDVSLEPAECAQSAGP